MKPLCIDLFCGLGGWTEGFLAEGWDVVGFDIERHQYGAHRYPAQLVLQDVMTIHGSQFRNADCIVASPPCQRYSWLAMPWSRSKSEHSQAAKALRREWETNGPDNRLFDACFRIQREACEAAGRFIPLIVENVRGAQEWVGIAGPCEHIPMQERWRRGRSAWNHGSFHLWGDVPALMPINLKVGMKFNPDGTNHSAIKNRGGSWFNIGSPGQKETNRNPVHELVGQKTQGGSWFRDPNSTCRKHGSRSKARKAASAQIAKIPLPLSQWIASVYYPRDRERVA